MKKTFCSSSLLALTAALAMPQARAQTAFQGTPTVAPGASPTITQGTNGGTTDLIVLNDAQTVINWKPNDTSGTGVIDFLPNGRTAMFTNAVSGGVSDFTVLNRILPVDGSGASVSRVIAFNGTVKSQINGQSGGSVWFYSPGGIIAGPTSIFNVGSLVLTSNDIDTSGGLYGSSNNTIRFRGVAGSSAAVEVQAGAQINALAAGSYVALVAPRVVQAGTVNVDGSTAYVAAEQADITINGGLFNITVTAGTTDANGVVHSGTTTGPASTGSADTQRIYMVAVPKNNALTMLLSGSVGYTPAAAATPDGSAVVLSAGYDVVSGDPAPARNATASANAGFNIGAGNWQSDLTGAATGDIVVQSSAAPATHFLGNVSLSAEGSILLRADILGAITADKDMNLSAGNGATGGRIDLLTFGGSGSAASNGQIAIAGNLTLDASGFGDAGGSALPPVGADASGGVINLIAAGGSIQAAGLSATAAAYGGYGSNRSGNATGGAITLSASTAAGPSGTEAGTLGFGNVTLNASASTGSGQFSPPVDGGNASGGTISIGASGGSFSATHLDAFASGSGGDASGVAGTGLGGNVTLSASASGGQRGSFSLTNCASFFCEIRADGSGASGSNGSNGTGGSILLYASDADFSAPGGLILQADGNGGAAAIDGVAGRGGDGLGGSVTVESRLGAAGTAAMTFGNLRLSAAGIASPSIDGVTAYNDGNGGNGTGGTVSVSVMSGSLTANLLDAQATGSGGAAASNCPSCEGAGTTPFQAGTGTGGSSSLLISGGTANIGTLTLGAIGTGGEAAGADTAFDPQSVAALAGIGQGGAASLESQGGTLQLGALTIDASGAGGAGAFAPQEDGADGGIGRGGSAGLLMTAGSNGQILVDGGIIVQSLGKGGIGSGTSSDGPGTYYAGRGGGGTGGTVDVTLAGGTLTAPSLQVSAEGVGGSGGDNGSDGAGGDAGNGTGGAAHFAYLNEGHSIGDITIKADGQGGQAGNSQFISGYDASNNPIYDGLGAGGKGGAGFGGTADMRVDVDPVFVNLTVSADGIGSVGGNGSTGGGGGAGTGGIAMLNLGFGSTTVSGALRVTALGVGGLGGTGYDDLGGRGGDATGGSATLALSGTATMLNAGNIVVLAEALGGDGGASGLRSGAGLAGADGGNATGGAALFDLSAGATAITGDTLLLSGNATGGAGALGTAGPVGGNGGAGGNGLAGSATLRVSDAHITFSSSLPKAPGYSITAVGQGGAGADGSTGSNAGLSGGLGGRGGDGTGGLAAFYASNGDYLLGSLALLADGLGGVGGAGGVGPAGTASAAGVIGTGAGGTADFVNGDGGSIMSGAFRQLDSLAMSASGVTASGRVQFTDSSGAANGGLRVNGSVALASLGTPVAGFSGIYVSGTANVVQIGGSADFTSDGPLSFAFTGTGGMNVAGALTGTSSTRIDLSHSGRPAGSDSLIADSILFSTPGDVSFLSAGSLRAANDLKILSSAGNINLASGSRLSAGGDLSLFAQGSVNGAGAGVNAVGSVAIGLGGGGDILLGDLISGGLLDQADVNGNALGAGGLAIGGNFAISGQLGIGPGMGTISAATITIGTLTADSQQLTATGGGIQINDAAMTGDLTLTGQGISAGRLVVGGQSVLNAGTAGLTVNDILSTGAITATGGTVNMASTGSMTISLANASGGALILNAAGTLSIADAGASGAMMLDAGGTVTLSRLISAPTISVGSSDIVIGAAAQVGNGNATSSVIFNAVNMQKPAYVGGNDVAGAYSLSAAELARVFAGNITVNATRQAVAGSPDMIVQDLTIGTGNLASAGLLTLATPGRLRVQGTVRLTGRSAQGGLTLSAGEALEVIAGAGLVDVSDANGGLGGVLTLTSPTIIAATLAAIGDVNAASSLTARELRLAQNDGLVMDGGLLRAGVIQANVTNGFYIQNLGLSTDFAARRGFTANDLLITTQGALTPIAINGQLLLPTGAVVTGRDVIPLVAINAVRGGRVRGYAAGSKINGCLIASAGACVTPGFDSRDIWNGVLDPSVTVGHIFTLSLIELRDIVAQGYPPLIDEPVTGAGNEDLWERHCGGADEPACGDGGTP